MSWGRRIYAGILVLLAWALVAGRLREVAGLGRWAGAVAVVLFLAAGLLVVGEPLARRLVFVCSARDWHTGARFFLDLQDPGLGGALDGLARRCPARGRWRVLRGVVWCARLLLRRPCCPAGNVGHRGPHECGCASGLHTGHGGGCP